MKRPNSLSVETVIPGTCEYTRVGSYFQQSLEAIAPSLKMHIHKNRTYIASNFTYGGYLIKFEEQQTCFPVKRDIRIAGKDALHSPFHFKRRRGNWVLC